MSNVAYLACPYTDPNPKIKLMRYRAVTWTAYELMKAGTLVYSPLTHNIPLADLGIHGNWVTWKEFDHAMLSRCNRLILLKLPGWEASKGVAAELEFAKDLNLPIEERDFCPEKIKLLSETTASPFEALISRLLILYNERNWQRFHSPKNLAMNVGVEAGELMDHFRWLNDEESFVTDPKKISEIEEEIGDVFLSLLYLSQRLGIDPLMAAQHKLTEISKKYPVELTKGKNMKYTEYSALHT